MNTNKVIASRIRKLTNDELVYVHHDVSEALAGMMSVEASNDWMVRMGGGKLLSEITACEQERARRGL